MQKLAIYILKSLKTARIYLNKPLDKFVSCLIFYGNGVEFSTYQSNGWPKVNVGVGGKCILGKNFKSNNREIANPIGRFNRCSIIVGRNAKLIIGDNVGISSTAIVCHELVTIGNNVNIGGNVVIYDTDFHSLNPYHRLDRNVDKLNTKTNPVSIGDNVFIGAHSTILKGVQIGVNSIVGAGSVVTKSIPDNEIWGGNPARFIKNI